MTISYNWLTQYIPLKLSAEKLSDILTSIGLEVESLEKYEAVKGSLRGLVVGEVLEVRPHPNAERLKITEVNTGEDAPLHIVCGAPNVAAGQKVVVAAVGTTIYPLAGDAITMKAAKIRGEQSMGMICAEDEIGLGPHHDGILVLADEAVPGTPAADYFHPEEDWIYEIGLTPNRMDATSHLGVARDVCAWLSSRQRQAVPVLWPEVHALKADNHSEAYSVTIENEQACPRYAGVALTGITVAESPGWLKKRLTAIGVRPINNVVDITNFVLHELGQPLHAFDGDAIAGKKIIVKNLPEGTPFVTLDGKTRKLHGDDLMICDEKEAMCIAGVFGGLHSGVTQKTTSLFLESACFDKGSIRRTSFRHDLRTDAAMRFEKGVDISGVPYALNRAVDLMQEICGARLSSGVIDVYPHPRPQTRIRLSYDYLDRLSGKHYDPERVTTVLQGLGFDIVARDADSIQVAVPYSKTDVNLPADVVEEVMRIDGYDEIAIPTHITMAPSPWQRPDRESLKQKVSAYLVSNGFYEIFTNSITNSRYYEQDNVKLIRLLNSLNTELDVMRPALLETGLEAVARNINHKQTDLLLYEFGKTYQKDEKGYVENEVLALFITGNKYPENWMHPAEQTDNYFLKGHIRNIFASLGIEAPAVLPASDSGSLELTQHILLHKEKVGICGQVCSDKLQAFGVKQPVWYAALRWQPMIVLSEKKNIRFREVPRYPAVRRDLALILDESIPFVAVEQTAQKIKSNILESVNLFDVFKNPKLGEGKKSYAVNFTFRHPEKTLTDKEIDQVIQKLIGSFQRELKAEIRK